MPKLCLNMIIKNESKIITRLLDSVCNIIDGYCICDTGSSDNSVELIKKYFDEKGISGNIIYKEFHDFGFNRSYSLNACREYTEYDYILLLDADMVLEGLALNDPKKFKENLKADAYNIFQGNSGFYYKNTRIVRNNKKFSYWGVTHEYLNSPPNSIVETLDYEFIRIHDIGDGGAKTDKFERDIRLLKQGLVDMPNNDRYTFYLGNSYKDAGQPENAIETYKKRVELGGWRDEIWNSYYYMGLCYMSINKPVEAINSWLEALNTCNERIENIYEIIKHYRMLGKNALAYSFYIMADDIRSKYPANPNLLFLHNDVYNYKLDYELSILGFYVNYKKYNMLEVLMNVMKNTTDHSILHSVMGNYKFYTNQIKQYDILEDDLRNILNSLIQPYIGDINSDNEFVSSTPSLIYDNNELIVNVRYVNYKIDENGNYLNKDKIITINRMGYIELVEGKWKVKKIVELQHDKSIDNNYVGIEDVRLFKIGDSLYYNGNRGLNNGNMVVEMGNIDQNSHKVSYDLLKIDNQKMVEKNWVLLPNKNTEQIKMIYGWSPLRIGNIIDGNFITTNLFENVPRFFENLRGSTNGLLIDNEIWLLCHSVSYEERRYYYHIMIVLDAETYNLKSYNPYFTFEGEKVEYSLGLVYMKNTNEFLIGYSVYDNTTKYIKISKTYFDERSIRF